MSYIGNTNTTQAFTPAVDFFNGNGSTTAFTLSKPVASVAQVQAVISNVPQNPGSAFTVSGNTITFTSAPPSGTSNIYVYYTSPITQVIAPGQGTVTTTSLMDGSVTPAKLSTGGPSWDTSGNATLTGNITLNNGTADGAQLTLASSGYSNWNIDNYSGNFRWYYNASEYMRLDASGNLGVGTTSPSTYGKVVSYGGTFSLVTDTAAQRRLSFYSTANGTSENAYIQVQNDGATTNTGEMLFATKNSGGTLAERARITAYGVLQLVSNQMFLSGGNIGIAIANGSANLNSTWSVTFNAGSQSSLFVFAAFNHYGLISGYGCSRLAACSVGAGGGSENNISNAATANGGSFTFSPSTSTITVTHNAGSYAASGQYIIIVIGNQVSI